MSLRTLIARHLEKAAGAYMPNHFLLELDVNTPFIGGTDDAPTQNNEHLHVFTHEYWHYWQNISTISGFKSFAFSQHLLSYFTPTLMPRANGLSSGSSILSVAGRADLRTLVKMQLDLDGDDAPTRDLAIDFDLDFVVVDVRQTDDDQVFRGARVPNPIVEIELMLTWPNGSSRSDTLQLGALAIEESVAYLVEEQIRAGLPDVPDSPPPALPYRVVERVIEHFAGSVDSFTAAALGTLSLLSPHPGLALVTLSRHYATALNSGASPAVALQAVLAAHWPGMTATIDRILTGDLQELVQMHEERGLMEGALKHLSGTMLRALERRKRDPLFDLRFLFPAVEVGALLAHQTEFPPCDLLQERPGDDDDFERDAMHSFDATPEDECGHRPTDFTRSLQAQQHYLSSHLDHEAGHIDPSESVEAQCPYYNACGLPLRRSTPEVCALRPWEAYQANGDGCWYATAVASSLGSVQIRKRS